MKVQSAWPGGEVELPEFRLADDQVGIFPSPQPSPTRGEGAKQARAEGLKAVILGLARTGLKFHGHGARPGLDREISPRCNREAPGPGRETG